MILHCVFCNFRDDVPAAQRTQIFQKLEDLSASIDGVMAFEYGANRDFENKSPDHGEGFIIRFSNEASLQTYAEHPTHKILGGQLCDLCVGGLDGLVVYDLEV